MKGCSIVDIRIRSVDLDLTWIAALYFLFVLLWHGHWELPLETISTIGVYCTTYQFDLQIYFALSSLSGGRQSPLVFH
jgi:hypothetical protein